MHYKVFIISITNSIKCYYHLISDRKFIFLFIATQTVNIKMYRWNSYTCICSSLYCVYLQWVFARFYKKTHLYFNWLFGHSKTIIITIFHDSKCLINVYHINLVKRLSSSLQVSLRCTQRANHTQWWHFMVAHHAMR